MRYVGAGGSKMEMFASSGRKKILIEFQNVTKKVQRFLIFQNMTKKQTIFWHY